MSQMIVMRCEQSNCAGVCKNSWLLGLHRASPRHASSQLPEQPAVLCSERLSGSCLLEDSELEPAHADRHHSNPQEPFNAMATRTHGGTA